MTRVVLQFNRKRFDRSMQLIGKIVCYMVALSLTVIMLGGDYLLRGQVKDFATLVDDGGYKPMQPSLFPGASLEVVDIFYYIFFALVLFFSFLLCCMCPASYGSCAECCDDSCGQGWKDLFSGSPFANALLWLWARPHLSVFSVPIFLAILHLFANVHWAIYCGVGLIPSHNCFMVFDYRSLLVGFAGLFALVLLLAVIVLLIVVAYGMYRAASWCCCFQLVEKPDNNSEMEEGCCALEKK